MWKKIMVLLFIGIILITTGLSEEVLNIETNPNKDLNKQNIQIESENIDNKEEEIIIGNDIKLIPNNPIDYHFQNVSVHDPSILKVDETFYIFGSHLAAAKSKDLMNWELIASGVQPSNPIIPDAMNEMKEAFEWAKTNTFWAPDVIQLNDGRYYMYYCTCEGSSPLSALGVAVSDNVEGPYKDIGIILKSGMGPNMPSEDGNVYDATVHPNVVDPCVFYDAEGKLWMVYGSYSGGIYVLEMDPETGLPLHSGYGKKICGGNHARIEGPYVLYSPETEYYYLFLSFGGLDSRGGYNIRVARSKNPDGPYYDPSGNDMINCKGAPGTFFDDASIEKYGAKLMGGHRFAWIEGEINPTRFGYLSPGHNSAYYDEETGQYFLIFHTRFERMGEYHEVRVHQMYINDDGWPVVAPYRYRGETSQTFNKDDVTGIYKYINHGKSINKTAIVSELIQLHSDNTISGVAEGRWKLKDDGRTVEFNIEGEIYKGIFNVQWDEYGKKNVMTFTALSDKGIAIWGSGIWAIE